jgi:hypothetical protein
VRRHVFGFLLGTTTGDPMCNEQHGKKLQQIE